MRRALVLTDEVARHPFRASLLPDARKIAEAENRLSWRRKFGLKAEDVQHFAMSYCACFLAATAFFL